jgi:hypothetical protein
VIGDEDDIDDIDDDEPGRRFMDAGGCVECMTTPQISPRACN